MTYLPEHPARRVEAFLKGELPVDEVPRLMQDLAEMNSSYLLGPAVARCVFHCIENGLIHVRGRGLQ